MELEELIERITEILEDVKEHLADYCWISVEDVEATIEYLEQLKVIKNT